MADARRRRQRMTAAVSVRADVYKRLRAAGIEPHNALIASGIAIELKGGAL